VMRCIVIARAAIVSERVRYWDFTIICVLACKKGGGGHPLSTV
jgi:hypothetical protein